jgi:hypothetical protein
MGFLRDERVPSYDITPVGCVNKSLRISAPEKSVNTGFEQASLTVNKPPVLWTLRAIKLDAGDESGSDGPVACVGLRKALLNDSTDG